MPAAGRPLLALRLCPQFIPLSLRNTPRMSRPVSAPCCCRILSDLNLCVAAQEGARGFIWRFSRTFFALRSVVVYLRMYIHIRNICLSSCACVLPCASTVRWKPHCLAPRNRHAKARGLTLQKLLNTRYSSVTALGAIQTIRTFHTSYQRDVFTLCS